VEPIRNDHFRRVHGLALQAKLPNCSRYQRRRQALSQAGYRVQRSGRQLSQQSCPVKQPAAFRKNFLHLFFDRFPRAIFPDKAVQGLRVLLSQTVQNGRALVFLARSRSLRRFDQTVRHSAHRGNDSNAWTRPGSLRDDLRRPRQARGIPQGRSAKFHDLQSGFHLFRPVS
jgi:hypothetical protein